MKQGQTYHEFNCPCGFCKMGDTKHPDHRMRNDDGELMYVKDRDQICQATFKEHCQYPKCDCDRPVTAAKINSTEFPRFKNIPEEIIDVLDGPEQECYPLCQKGMTKDTCPYNPNLGCDCGANPPSGLFVTDRVHGGKITCHKCNGFILEEGEIPYYEFSETRKSVIASFHKDCYNPYEHYYGLNKPID